ncbi:unnamed protein product, partial [Rhizoctonia solani]
SFTSEPVLDSQKDSSGDAATEKDSISEDSEYSTAPPLNLILLNPVPDSKVPPTESEVDQTEETRDRTRLIEESLLDNPITETENDESAVAVDEDAEARIDVALVEPTEDLQEPLDIMDTNQHQFEELPVEIGGVDTEPDSAGTTTVVEQPVDPKQSYRILVENESELLLSVCTLIGKEQRVICYMPCGTTPLAFYKQLIENVTGVSVFFAERMGVARRDAAYKKYLDNDNSVVLIPGTLLPNIVMEGGNTWVIHVGWPPNREKYVSQIKNHQAKNNVIVACADDLDFYPSGAPLMDQTHSWPKLGDAFTDSVNALRQSFEQKLTDIPDEAKAKVYADWIQSHGVYGPRYVKTWDSTVLVQRANFYLVHILKYRQESFDYVEEGILPEVSSGFVGQNLLESAVQAGVLHVKHDSSINHISSLAHGDFKPPTPVIAEVGTSTKGGSAPGPSGEKVKTQRAKPRAETPSEELNFKLISGHTYFTVEEDFDAMPLISFLAGKYDKTICFLEGQGSLRHYQKLFSKILQPKFLVVAPEATNSDQANTDAASLFINSSVPAMLLLTYSTTNLPPALREKRVGCCVYWGFHLPLKQAKKHRDQVICSSTTMIISKSQQHELKRQATDVTEHPSAQALLDLKPKSLLWPMRNTTVSVLMADETTVKGLYVNRIYGLGTVSRAERSAAAQRKLYAWRIDTLQGFFFVGLRKMGAKTSRRWQADCQYLAQL